MASVSWVSAEDQIIALRRQNAAAEAAAPVDTGLDIARLHLRYTIEGTIRRGGRCTPSMTGALC
jgi:type IV secretion system protein VirB9